ncbi:hypothetical protein ACGFMM_35360 [Streptomyces sp. NPDC048604]|uniref:hypothetical protein n=1 Tax=Streptomyces sp. NPDC048604 TaxID=3365578 RepID=UPI0037173FB2
MFVFVCAECEAALTAPLHQVEFPDHAHQRYGNGVSMPVLMEEGTFAVDPLPSGPPWRPFDEIPDREAEALGWYAPVWAISYGSPGAVLLAPGDSRGTALLPGGGEGACCGFDGREGPNTVCLACGALVATRIDDCSLWQTLWLHPDAVRRVAAAGPRPGPLTWETVLAERRIVPPVDQLGHWSPVWEAAVGAAVARVVAASEGRPVDVPEGRTAEVFRHTLDGLLPRGSEAPALRMVLAGPGLPAPDESADLVLVPRHPETGEAWGLPGERAGRRPGVVPMAAAVWLCLAFGQPPPLPEPASGRLARDVLRDEPLPLRPNWSFRPDRRVFVRTLARQPQARALWLRDLLDALVHYRPRYHRQF